MGGVGGAISGWDMLYDVWHDLTASPAHTNAIIRLFWLTATVFRQPLLLPIGLRCYGNIIFIRLHLFCLSAVGRAYTQAPVANISYNDVEKNCSVARVLEAQTVADNLFCFRLCVLLSDQRNMIASSILLSRPTDVESFVCVGSNRRFDIAIICQ